MLKVSPLPKIIPWLARYNFFESFKKVIPTKSRRKQILNLDDIAIIRYATFTNQNSMKQLNKTVANYFRKNFHIDDKLAESYIKDYEIIKQNGDEVSVILVAILHEKILPLLRLKPKSITLKSIEAAKKLAKNESGKYFLYTGHYYFYIENNTIEDIIDAGIYTPKMAIYTYGIDKVYFLKCEVN